jgi:hypothetical protein
MTDQSLTFHFPNMKPASPLLGLFAAVTVLGFTSVALAQAFNSGSTGADGPLDVATDTVIPARTNGVFHYTTIRVRPGARLTFERNAANTPIHLLATDNVVIAGVVDVSGGLGGPLNGGEGGPGGFDGGKPGIAGKPPGAGYGPGGGKGGVAGDLPGGAGGGSYATIGVVGVTTNKGAVYGSDLLLPLVGGSGGGGQPAVGGSGGGGAILIASSKDIEVTGQIMANGATGNGWGYGSGGAIRLVANRVAGTGILTVYGHSFAGDGRIRVDLVQRDGLALNFGPGTPGTLVVGSLLTVFPPVSAQLDVITVAGQRIAPGTRTSVFVNLPPGSTGNQDVEVEARDFNQQLPITVGLIPDSGPPSFYNATLDNVAENPVRQKIRVSIPANVLVRVMAWTR